MTGELYHVGVVQYAIWDNTQGRCLCAFLGQDTPTENIVCVCELYDVDWWHERKTAFKHAENSKRHHVVMICACALCIVFVLALFWSVMSSERRCPLELSRTSRHLKRQRHLRSARRGNMNRAGTPGRYRLAVGPTRRDRVLNWPGAILSRRPLLGPCTPAISAPKPQDNVAAKAGSLSGDSRWLGADRMS